MIFYHMALQSEGTTLCPWSHRAEQYILARSQVAQKTTERLIIAFNHVIYYFFSQSVWLLLDHFLLLLALSPPPSPFPSPRLPPFSYFFHPNVMPPSIPHSFPLSHHSPQLIPVSQDLFRCHLQQISAASEDTTPHEY